MYKQFTVKDILLKNWHFARILRLTLGTFIIIQGVIEHEIAFTLMGILFAGMAIFSIGCCAPGGCQTVVSSKEQSSDEAKITYEEVE